MKSGFISIVGRPNVGKSTLLNLLIKKKVAIVSNKVGTTRNIITGIYNDNDSQIVFIDTPGINRAKDKLGTILNKKSYNMSTDADIVLFLIDISSGFGKGDQAILDFLKKNNKEIILILNKIDLIKKEQLIKEIDKLKDLYDFKEIIPISSLKNINVNDLLITIKKYLKNDIKYYDDNVYTNLPLNFIVSEIVREKILNLTSEEVPHSITCFIEKITEKKDLVSINGVIVVDRDNLKAIIIGKNGNMLKEIGTYARKDLEELFNKKVYLELFVKTIKNWRDSKTELKNLGLDELEG